MNPPQTPLPFIVSSTLRGWGGCTFHLPSKSAEISSHVDQQTLERETKLRSTPQVIDMLAPLHLQIPLRLRRTSLYLFSLSSPKQLQKPRHYSRNTLLATQRCSPLSAFFPITFFSSCYLNVSFSPPLCAFLQLSLAEVDYLDIIQFRPAAGVSHIRVFFLLSTA
jgi:hypothetical protein